MVWWSDGDDDDDDADADDDGDNCSMDHCVFLKTRFSLLLM